MSKTSEVIPADPLTVHTMRLAELSSEAIRAEFARGLQLTLEGVTQMAACLRVLEDRHEDTSDLRGVLMGQLRRIAHGLTLPEVVVGFGAYPLLLNKVSMLPLADQRELTSGKPIIVVVYRPGQEESSRWDHRQLEPLRLTREQIHQVFAPDHVRSETEQKMVIESRLTRPAKATPKATRVRADHERGGLVLGRSFATQAQIVEALGELCGEEGDRQDASQESKLLVTLSEEQHRRLKVAAARGNTSMSELARDALRAAGLI